MNDAGEEDKAGAKKAPAPMADPAPDSDAASGDAHAAIRDEIVNPYIAGAPVTGTQMFFGREDVFQWIENSITGQFKDNILVVHGQRRVGKTSVLKQLGNRLPGRYIPIFFDLQGRTHTTLDRFLWWLAREIIRVLKQERNIDIPLPEKEAFARDSEFFENRFLPGVASSIGSQSLLLTIDEFDNLEESEIKEELARPLIDYLRRLMGNPGLNFIFSIGSSGRKLENMQAAYTDFFKTALYKKISFLSRDQTAKLITRPVEHLIAFDPAAVDSIFEITYGHPYFTQLICHELFSLCQRTGQRRLRREDVEAILDDVVERGTVNLKFVWDDASDMEKWILAALAHMEKPETRLLAEFLKSQHVRFQQQELTSGLLHLREKDVLTEDNRFIIQLLERWLRKNRPLEQVREELTEVNPIANRYIEIGNEFKNSRLYEKAIESFQEALAVDSDNIQAQVNLGLVYMDQKACEKAVVEFEKALAMDDEDVAARSELCEAHLALGDAALEKRRTREAVQSYRRVLAINAEHTEARQRMAEIQRANAEKALAENRDEDALNAFADALKFTPEDPDLIARVESIRSEKRAKVLAGFMARAEKEAAVRNWEAAIAMLAEAQRLDPQNEPLQMRLAQVKEAQRTARLDSILARAAQAETNQQWNQAIAILDEYLALQPGDAGIQKRRTAAQEAQRTARLEAILARASQAETAKQWDQAISILQEYLVLQPGEEGVRSRIANAQTEKRLAQLAALRARALRGERAEKFDDAIAAWREYLTLDPDDKEHARDQMEEVKKKQALAKDYDEAQKAIAKKHYERAIGLLKRIVVENAHYKDASALMSQAVELRRTAPKLWLSKWLWSGLGGVLVLGLGWLFLRPGSPVMSALFAPPSPTASPAVAVGLPASATPASIANARPTATKVPTAIPLSWERLNSGQFISRDTIHAIAINPSDPGVIYVGTERAGVFKSIDGGVSWQPAQNGMDGASIDTLVIDPQRPDTLYAGVYNGGLYKTTDGGANWVSFGPDFVSSGGVDSIVLIDPTDHLHLYYAPNALSFESQDGGKTWSKFNLGSPDSPCPTQIKALLLDPADQSLYASDGTDKCSHGVYQSGDHGRTWNLVGLNGSDINGLFMGEDLGGDKLLIATGNGPQNQAFFSTDHGKSWKTQAISCNSFAVDPQTTSTLFCGTDKGAIKSTNGGSSWTNILEADFGDVTAMAVLGGASSRLAVGATKVAISTDQGASWTSYDNGLAGQQVDLTLDPSNASILYLQYGMEWYGDENNCQVLYRSMDAGRTWNPISSTGCGLTFGPGGTDLYRAGGGQLFHSNDQGAHWNNLAMPSGCTRLYANPFAPGTLIASCSASDPNTFTFFYSNDFGKTWQTSSGDDSDRISVVQLFFGGSTGQRVYAIAGPDYRSDDGGKSWGPCGDPNVAQSSLSDSRLIIDPQNPDHILRTSKGAGVLISTDGCRTWTASNTGLGSLFVNSIAMDPNRPDTMYAGTDGGAYLSIDGGDTWGEIDDGLLNATVVYSILADSSSNVFAATPYGVFQLKKK